ncbi:MAG TPA: hypothetical protein VHA12_00665 [Candidatus Nanoarchaeia archaeon]|nr:hypothetical protein [Candidatus Nanoarchaeia archaeon]
MGTVEEVAFMKREGRSDAEIASNLRKKGLPEQEITSAISQTKIKEAVAAPSAEEAHTQEYGEEQMSPSLMSPGAQYQSAPVEEQPQQEAAVEQQSAYPEYQSYAQTGSYDQQQYASGNIGAEVITEIADQVVAEKLSPILGAMDKILDMKSNTEAQLRYLDERLKRIEKIIDRLQLSVLQRVGEYVSNVEEIKQEMQETQKTFKALVDKKGM